MKNIKKKIGYLIIGSLLSISFLMPIAHAHMQDDHIQFEQNSNCCAEACTESPKLLQSQNMLTLVFKSCKGDVPISNRINFTDLSDIIEFYCQKSDNPINHTFKTTVKRE